MLTEDELVSLEKVFFKSDQKPSPMLFKLSKHNFGIGLVLRYLDETNHPVSAVDISRYMSVSTARVAVLLRTMTKKGLIERGFDLSDGRKILVRLSTKGKEFVAAKKAERRRVLSCIVETVGLERIKSFVETSEKISEVIRKEAGSNSCLGFEPKNDTQVLA